MNGKYILTGTQVVACDDLMVWAKWVEKADRRVRLWQQDSVLVSTVFLGLDYGYGERLSVFETMVFGGPLSEEMDRYATYEEAVAGHDAMVERVKLSLDPQLGETKV